MKINCACSLVRRYNSFLSGVPMSIYWGETIYSHAKKNSSGVCIESVFNFGGQAIKQTRNIMSDARVCAAFVYWEAMQVCATYCIIIMNLVI